MIRECQNTDAPRAVLHQYTPENRITGNDPLAGIQWDPIKPFNSTTGDVTLIMIPSNGVRYEQPVDDPIFAAHDEIILDTIQGPKSIYLPDKSAPLLGCLDQWQFCNPNTERCSKLSSPNAVIFELLDTDFWNNNSVQEATYNRFLARTELRTVHGSVDTRGVNALRGKLN
jgi:hypothetical protein